MRAVQKSIRLRHLRALGITVVRGGKCREHVGPRQWFLGLEFEIRVGPKATVCHGVADRSASSPVEKEVEYD